MTCPSRADASSLSRRSAPRQAVQHRISRQRGSFRMSIASADEALPPKHESQEAPDLMAVVRPLSEVVTQQVLDGLGIQNPRLAHSGCRQAVGNKGLQATLDPADVWDIEALLPPPNDLPRQTTCHALLQQVLLVPEVPQLQSRRSRGDEFHEAVVEVRLARFQAMRHC